MICLESLVIEGAIETGLRLSFKLKRSKLNDR
jgi:hypothetical protein